jgi:hypothetical protein
MPVATGNVDDLVEASIKGALEETSFYNEEDEDIDVWLGDTNEIDGFGQIYNENEL